jgi:hypothetical protein
MNRKFAFRILAVLTTAPSLIICDRWYGMKLLLCSLVAVTMALPVVPSQQETGLKAAQPITGQSYPNTTEGLRQLERLAADR